VYIHSYTHADHSICRGHYICSSKRSILLGCFGSTSPSRVLEIDPSYARDPSTMRKTRQERGLVRFLPPFLWVSTFELSRKGRHSHWHIGRPVMEAAPSCSTLLTILIDFIIVFFRSHFWGGLLMSFFLFFISSFSSSFFLKKKKAQKETITD
jgi:hypothetical protein